MDLHQFFFREHLLGRGIAVGKLLQPFQHAGLHLPAEVFLFFLQLTENAQKQLPFDRLDNVLLYLVFDSLPGIIKFFITGYNNHLYIRHVHMDIFRQLQAVHPWHDNVCQHHIHIRILFQKIHRFPAVFHSGSQLRLHVTFPDDLYQPLPGIIFILGNQYFHIVSPARPVSGSSSRSAFILRTARVHRPYSLYRVIPYSLP